MRYRLLGEEASMTVAPSCRASVHVRSCATSVDKLTLAVQVVNYLRCSASCPLLLRSFAGWCVVLLAANDDIIISAGRVLAPQTKRGGF
eukprot:1946578-Rhodomonas_salina.1